MAETADDVAKALTEFFASAEKPILFAGAGVSMLAGLPDWSNLLKSMAESIRAKDPLTANQITTYVAKGSLTRAAEFFLITDEVHDAEKHDILKSLLKTYDSTPLLPLAKLPFTGVLTTNFDRSIFDALAIARGGKTANDYALGDPKFIQAAFEQDLFVARIHGAVEFPPSVVLSENQFKTLLENDVYLDVLSENLLHRSILFLGFSFYDPAIKFVFERLEKKFGPALPSRHLALLPSSNSAELISKAVRLNLSVCKYDPSNQHTALWAGIEKYSRNLKPAPRQVVSTSHPYAVTKQYLAACYARASSASATVPLREIIIEGIISAVLQSVFPKGLAPIDIHEGVRRAIGVKGDEFEPYVESALRQLVDNGLARKHKNTEGKGIKYAWTNPPDADSTLSDAVQTLTKSVAERAYALLGWTPKQHVLDAVAVFIKEVVHQRGWDLGAAFAAGRAPDGVSYKPLLLESAGKMPTFDRQRLEQVMDGLFLSPTETESKLLGELGRISFALELAFQAPRSTLFHRTALPRRVYFDANFLMPAFVEGHPHFQTYRSALKRLALASKRAGITIQLVAYYGYLNEIISHRNLALDYLNESGSDFEMVLKSDARYHGPGNINVFLGGYANALHNDAALDFEEYLSRAAPYKNESELRRWLDKQGILVVDCPKTPPYSNIYGVLERANGSRLAKSGGKEVVLIEHDAAQMSLLENDRQRGEKALFVTADRLLFGDIQNSPFSELCEFMVSNVGLVQLIDLLVGLEGEDRSLGDLLWSSRLSEKNDQLRTVLTIEALSKYQKGLTMKLADVVEAQSEKVTRELERLGLNLDSHDPKQRVKAFRSLNTLKADFFEVVAKGTQTRGR